MTVSDHPSPTAGQAVAPSDGSGLHVYRDGPCDAPTLLLIHGTGASGRSWEPMVPLLVGSHHVVRVDLLGCGRSAGLDGTPYSVADQARRVGAVADRLGVQSLVAAGHSSGAAVATALAEQRPELVSAVVVIDFGPDMSAYLMNEDSPAPAASQPSPEDRFRRLLRSGFSADFEIPQDLIDQFRAVDPAVFAEASAANCAYLDERSLPDRLAPLGKPLLVVFGEDDSRWRASRATDYLTVPGATVEFLERVGHSPILEDPVRTAAIVSAFTARHPSPADRRAETT